MNVNERLCKVRLFINVHELRLQIRDCSKIPWSIPSTNSNITIINILGRCVGSGIGQCFSSGRGFKITPTYPRLISPPYPHPISLKVLPHPKECEDQTKCHTSTMYRSLLLKQIHKGSPRNVAAVRLQSPRGGEPPSAAASVISQGWGG